jgi:uncharacterized protein YukE
MSGQDSFRDLLVPEGDPGTLRGAAGRLSALSGRLSQVSSGTRGLPGLTSGWEGDAQQRFVDVCVINCAVSDHHANSLDLAAQASTNHADRLEDAQNRARQAIADAIDADARIRAAQASIAVAQAAQASAQQAYDSASAQADGPSAPWGSDALAHASQRLASARADESSASGSLTTAEADLQAALKRGRAAMQDAEHALLIFATTFSGLGTDAPLPASLGPAAIPGLDLPEGITPAPQGPTSTGGGWAGPLVGLGGILVNPGNGGFGSPTTTNDPIPTGGGLTTLPDPLPRDPVPNGGIMENNGTPKPPLPERPDVPEYPQGDPRARPPGSTWYGPGKPGEGEGSWVFPRDPEKGPKQPSWSYDDRESHGPHIDYRDNNGKFWRIYPDGSVEGKNGQGRYRPGGDRKPDVELEA